jgi:tRNA threonylcarbamoyladenosine biosynthesis protein TsaE
MTKTYIFLEKDIDLIVKDFFEAYPDALKIIFLGNLGAGKTTFIKAIGRYLGVQSDMSSPSFSLVNEYPLKNGQLIRHLDLYRLKSAGEAWDIGIEDFLYDEHYTFIEWAELIEDYLPAGSIKIEFSIRAEDTARILNVQTV